MTRVLLSNMGYARCIDGSLKQHMRGAHRHFWCPPDVQKRALSALKKVIHAHRPDICCLLEVDTGSRNSHGLNQLAELVDEEYRFFDAESKYGRGTRHRRGFMTSGKSNGFLARHDYAYEKLFFSVGTKRLIYHVALGPNLTLYFAHFSLKKQMRERQLIEMFELADATRGEVILMGDFNVLTGLDEVHHLLEARPLTLLNDPELHTFSFGKRKLVLDLCICSQTLAPRATLDILPQAYSDHAALLLTIH